MPNVFAIPVFFVIFRETIETGIIVSVLLAFLEQTLGPQHDVAVYKSLRRQVWLGTGIGFFICAAIGAGMIGAFYGLGKDKWAGNGDIWTGIFGLMATVIISLMGGALLRVSKLQDKWRVKLAKALQTKDSDVGRGDRCKRWAERYAMFLLPFVTVMREGLEAVIFLGGVSVGQPASSFPLAAISGLVGGILISYIVYRGGKHANIQIFLIVSTCFLYVVAAGIFTRTVWYFEAHRWARTVGGDSLGSGPGSYDIRQSVWHVNCCNPEMNGGGGWGIFNALLGWTNSATYGSVLSYNLYWLVVIVAFLLMSFNEKTGHWPFMKARFHPDLDIEATAIPGLTNVTLPSKIESANSSSEAIATDTDSALACVESKVVSAEVRKVPFQEKQVLVGTHIV